MNVLTNSKNVLTKCAAVFVACVLAISTSLAYAPQAAYAADEIPVGATSSTGFVQQITVKVANTDINETYTLAELQDLGAINTGSVSYLYKKYNSSNNTYEWNVMSMKNYVTLDKLFELAGATSYWTNNATLTFNAFSKDNSTGLYVNDEYTKWTFKKSDMVSQVNFYPYLKYDGSFYNNMETAYSAPLAIGFTRGDAVLNGQAGSTATSILTGGGMQATTQFGMGLDMDTLKVADGNGANMGKRLPTSITTIIINPA
jgi:hypothetical protein